MTDLDLELDTFYLKQICFWLRQSADCDKEVVYWEQKRKELRHDRRRA